MTQDSIGTILQSTKKFFNGTLLSRISGMARDMSMAYAFGTNPDVAALMVAFKLSNLFRRLFGEGAMQSAVIPLFEKYRQQSIEKACAFFRDLKCLLSLFLIALVTCSILGLFGISSLMNLSENNHQVVFLTALMFPSLLFICLYGLNSSLLQCEKDYFLPSIAPVACNLVWIGAVSFLYDLPTQDAVIWLAIAIVIGTICQWMITLPKTIGILRTHIHRSIWNDIQWFSQDVKNLLKPLSLGIIGVAASQVNNTLDSLFARYADLEGPAFLWYAIRIQQFPLSLFGIALSGAILPPLSRAIKNHDFTSFYQFLNFALLRTVALMIPISFAIISLSSSVNLIYGHGNFTEKAILETTYCLWSYGIGLFPMSCVLVLASAFYSQHTYTIPAKASVYSMLLNVILNAVFVFVFHLGAASIALATSMSAVFNAMYLYTKLPSHENYLKQTLFSFFSKIVIASFVCIVVGLLTIYLGEQVTDDPAWSIILGKAHAKNFSSHFPSQVSTCIFEGACFLVLLATFAWGLNISSLKLFFHWNFRSYPESENTLFD